MNIMLLIPPASLSGSYGNLQDFSNPQPAIGLAYIASVLRENGFPVSILDAYICQMKLDEIVEAIRVQQIDLLGISLLTTAVDVTTELVKHLRKYFPSLKILMGNVHASLFVEDVLQTKLADYVVHQEGEYSMLALVQSLEKGEDLRTVQGISYLENQSVITTEPRPLIDDLDKLPFPAWDLFPLDSYHTDPRTELISDATEMQILATRGCPMSCTFCSSRTEKNLGNKYRMRNPKNIADEIEYMVSHYGTKVFGFMDLAFPLIKTHAMAVFDEIIKRGLNKKIKWMTECRVKPLDLETLTKMREAGCRRINFGIESGNNRILKLLKKGFNTDDVRRAVKLANQAGIEVDGMFMIGLPTETETEIKDTIDFAVELGVRYAIINIFVPYPGSELYQILNKEGKINFTQWADFTSYPTYSGGKPVYTPDALGHEQLMQIQAQAMKRFYMRPKFILRELMHFKPTMIKKYWNGLRAVLSGN